MSLPEFITDRAVISQLACLAAVHYCAKRSVAERTANLTLTPPLLKAEDKAKADADKKAAADAAAAAGPRPPWYRRIFTYKTLEALFPLLVFGAIEFVILWVMPRVTSELFIKVFWVGVSSYLISGPISVCLYVFFGGPLTMAFQRGEKNPKNINLSLKCADPDNKPLFAVKRNRIAASIILTAGFVAYTAYDPLNYLMASFAGVLAISMGSSISFPKFSIRMASFICFGMVSSLAVLIPVVITVMRYLVPSNNGEKTESKGGMPPMPPWILSLMLIYNDCMMVFPIMFLVTAALRYDHFGGSSPALGPDKAPPGEAVDIPRSLKTRKGAMYRTAMATLVCTYLTSDVLVYYLLANGNIKIKAPADPVRERSDIIKIVSFALTNLLVPVTIAFVAWSKGELRSWWTYTETWIPKDSDDAMEQADINKAEKALIEPELVQPAVDATTVSEKA